MSVETQSFPGHLVALSFPLETMAVPGNRLNGVHNISPRDSTPASVSQVNNSSKVKHAGI